MKRIFKRTLSVFLAAVMVFGAAPLAGLVGLELPEFSGFFSADAVSSEEFKSGYYTYTIDENGNATITGADSSISGDVTIPLTFGDYPVTIIGAGAFYDCSGITSIIIPDSVISIGVNAFSCCTGLTGITIGDGVTSIGDCAFGGCTGLTSVTISDNVISIGIVAFTGCTGLTSITICNSLTSIGRGAFYNCTALTDVYFTGDIADWCAINFDGNDSSPMYYADNLYINGTLVSGELIIPEGVTRIPACAFASCNELISVTIPDSVTNIDNYAFNGCTGLTGVIIPDRVVSIGDSSFYNCSGLVNVVIGKSVSSIGVYAFSGCTGLTSVTIPDSVTNIDDYAFNGCTGLTGIAIPDSVISIGGFSFYNCTGLINVTIGKGVTSIDNAAFNGCTGLTSVTISNSVKCLRDDVFFRCTSLTNVYYTGNVDDWCAISFYSRTSNPMTYAQNLYINGAIFTGELIIPESVTNIDFTFINWKGLTSVTIPNSVASIGSSAFYGCEKLTSVTIPDSVTSIGSSTFYGCEKLTSVTIPDSVTSIGSSAFYGCETLTSVTIPNRVTNVGSQVFGYCSNLTSITIPDSVTSIGFGTFSGCVSLTNVYYTGDVADWCAINFGRYGRADSYHFYESNPMEYADNLYINGTLVSGELIIPEGVTHIPVYAFASCNELTSITIPDSVTSIGDYAFAYTSLTSITIPDSVTSIGEGAFICTNLHFIHISSNTEKIETSLYSSNSYFYICSDSEDCYAKEYSEENGYIFEVCDGNHENEENGHSPEWVFSKEYVCTEDNVKIKKCKYCGEVFEEELIYATDHTPGEWEISKESSCTEDGLMLKKCIVCDKILEEEIIPVAHISGEWEVERNSTCKEKGREVLRCIVCGKTIEEKEIPITTDHTPGEWEISKESSCTEDGLMLKKCTVCDEFLEKETIPAGHTPGEWKIERASTCKEKGMEVLRCTVCGVILETRDIDKSVHRPGDWDIYDKPTPEKKGKKRRHCTDCHDILDDVEMPKQKRISKDNENAVFEYSEEDYNGEVDFIIKKSSDEKPQDVIKDNPKNTRSVVYEISMTLNGNEIQPYAPIRIKLPLPEDYNSNNSYVCYVNTDNNTVEIIPSEEIDGYLVFEAAHFSYYAIVEEFDGNVSVRTPSQTEIAYGDSIILHADAEILPEGWTIEWKASNEYFSYTVSEDGRICEISPVSSGDTTFTATVYDANRNVISSDEQVMTSKAGFLQKIIAFFKKLFGLTKVIPNIIKNDF